MASSEPFSSTELLVFGLTVCFSLFVIVVIPHAAQNGLPVDPSSFFLWMTGISVVGLPIVLLLRVSGKVRVAVTVIVGFVLLGCAAACFWSAFMAAAAV